MPLSNHDKLALREDVLDLSRQSRIGPLSPWFDRELIRAIEWDQILPRKRIEWEILPDLTRKLEEYRTGAGVDTVVLGMSGGVDSALTAALFNVAIPGPLQDDSVLRAIYRGLATPERGSLVVPKALLALETIGDRCLSGRSVPVTQGFSQTTTTRDGFGTYKGESTETFDVTIRVRPLMVDWVSQQLRLYPFTGKTPIHQAVGELINRQGCGGREMRQFEEGLARLAGIDPAAIDAALGPLE